MRPRNSTSRDRSNASASESGNFAQVPKKRKRGRGAVNRGMTGVPCHCGAKVMSLDPTTGRARSCGREGCV